VRFVPLIGEHGWSEPAPDESSGPIEVELRPPARPQPPTGLLRQAAERLPDLDDPAFARLFDRFADARVVLLGEATLGTSEFYRARAAITRSLIERHGFTIVAVEADWPDAAAVDRYVRHKAPAADATPAFRRFPTWMWRNVEVHDFVDWLRAHNEGLEPTRRAGFYGLDIYNMSASMRAVIDYLEQVDPEAAGVARERYGCLTPWQHDPATYGRAVLSAGYAKCEKCRSRDVA
jgi:erythromycin esterase-like protein